MIIHHDGWKPLASVKEDVHGLFQRLNSIERMHPSPWVAARALLRQDPHAALPELDALLSVGC